MVFAVVSVESSGSTFVWQIVNALDKRRTKKAHTLFPLRPGMFVFFVYRDPRDVICSYAKRLYPDLIETEGLEAALIKAHTVLFVNLKRQNLIKTFLKAKEKQVCVIKYENYFGGDEGLLVDTIAERMKISLARRKRRELLQNFSIQKNKERADQLKIFDNFDRETHIHGNHISSNGKTGIWKSMFTEKVKQIVKENLGQLLIELKYEKDLDW